MQRQLRRCPYSYQQLQNQVRLHLHKALSCIPVLQARTVMRVRRQVPSELERCTIAEIPPPDHVNGARGATWPFHDEGKWFCPTPVVLRKWGTVVINSDEYTFPKGLAGETLGRSNARPGP
jgi:hypothetical protein